MVNALRSRNEHLEDRWSRRISPVTGYSGGCRAQKGQVVAETAVARNGDCWASSNGPAGLLRLTNRPAVSRRPGVRLENRSPPPPCRSTRTVALPSADLASSASQVSSALPPRAVTCLLNASPEIPLHDAATLTPTAHPTSPPPSAHSPSPANTPALPPAPNHHAPPRATPRTAHPNRPPSPAST